MITTIYCQDATFSHGSKVKVDVKNIVLDKDLLDQLRRLMDIDWPPDSHIQGMIDDGTSIEYIIEYIKAVSIINWKNESVWTKSNT